MKYSNGQPRYPCVCFLLLVVILTSCSIFTRAPSGPRVDRSRGKELEPRPRGALPPSFPRNPLEEARAELFPPPAFVHSDSISVGPGEDRTYQVPVDNPSVLLSKAFCHGGNAEELALRVFREGQVEPVMERHAIALHGSESIINVRMPITEEMLARGAQWMLLLANGSTQVASCELLIMLIDVP